MGCFMSVERNGSQAGDMPGFEEDYKKIINAKCPHIRLDCIKQLKTLKVKGENYNYRLRYGYVSQRGYYPHALGKANQDSYLVCESLLRDENCHMFGVFDGHGDQGDYCSYFAADKFPRYLTRELKELDGCDGIATHTEECYKNAFINTNAAMRASEIDDTLSGTTAIAIVVKGNVLYVGNVGDSRAIVASMVNGRPKVSPLSSDQTPFRKDERDRLRLKGAKIMTLDQIDGTEPMHDNWNNMGGDEIDEVGDPPRVWDSTQEKPGCAFTRSIGDACAEQVGVFAEPEVLSWSLTSDDQFAIIASDGVFEFLTSQAVVDMIGMFLDPLDAAKHIVSESYRLWLTYDDRTDDITIIVILFDKFEVIGTASHVADRSQSIMLKEASADVVRPVRTQLSRQMRKNIPPSLDEHESIEFDFAANATTKSPEDMARITNMISSNFMFQNLSPNQMEHILQVMQLKIVAEGELIIREGDAGDELYVIDSGEFNVRKKDDTGISQLVFTYTTSGAVFGELSLMYGKPRAASIYAATDGRLWSISRQAYRSCVMQKPREGLLKALHSIPVLSGLKITQLQRICERITVESYKENDVIYPSDKQVDWSLCVVLSGSITSQGTTPGGKYDHTFEQGTYMTAPNMKDIGKVTAGGRTTLGFILKQTFMNVVGQKGQDELEEQNDTDLGTVLEKEKSINLNFSKQIKADSLSMDSVFLSLGDFGFVGNYSISSVASELRSVKVISKKILNSSRMEQSFVNERDGLMELAGSCSFIPSILGTCSDSKVAMIVYGDQFVADLQLAISNGDIPKETVHYYCVCIHSGVSYLHESGWMYRFLNPSSVYLTSAGVPKLADFRYAKKMEGNKVSTVLGDPLYMAPEIISQQGYDYTVDLWAFGVLTYELCEGTTPFGAVDTNETKVFQSLASYKGTLEYTDKTPVGTREFINGFLRVSPKSRLGYDSSTVLSFEDYFASDFQSECPLSFTPSIIDQDSYTQPFDYEPFSSALLDEF